MDAPGESVTWNKNPPKYQKPVAEVLNLLKDYLAVKLSNQLIDTQSLQSKLVRNKNTLLRRKKEALSDTEKKMKKIPSLELKTGPKRTADSKVKLKIALNKYLTNTMSTKLSQQKLLQWFKVRYTWMHRQVHSLN